MAVILKAPVFGAALGSVDGTGTASVTGSTNWVTGWTTAVGRPLNARHKFFQGSQPTWGSGTVSDATSRRVLIDIEPPKSTASAATISAAQGWLDSFCRAAQAAGADLDFTIYHAAPSKGFSGPSQFWASLGYYAGIVRKYGFRHVFDLTSYQAIVLNETAAWWPEGQAGQVLPDGTQPAIRVDAYGLEYYSDGYLSGQRLDNANNRYPGNPTAFIDNWNTAHSTNIGFGLCEMGSSLQVAGKTAYCSTSSGTGYYLVWNGQFTNGGGAEQVEADGHSFFSYCYTFLSTRLASYNASTLATPLYDVITWNVPHNSLGNGGPNYDVAAWVAAVANHSFSCGSVPSKCTPGAPSWITDFQNFADLMAPSASLAITTSSLPSATQGTAYSVTLGASGGTPAYTWSVTSGALPTGLTLSSGGVLSGTPTAAATASFTVHVADSASHAASKALTLTVTSSLAITTASLPGATQGTAYSTTLAASGGTAPYTWAAVGSLPAGLALSSLGVLSGTPTAAGTFIVTAKVTDAASSSATATLSLRVTSSGTAGVPYTVATFQGPNAVSPSVAVTHITAAGDAIAVAVGFNNGSVIGVADSAGNIYSLAGTEANGSQVEYLFLAVSGPGGAGTPTVALALTDHIIPTFSNSGGAQTMIARACAGVTGTVDVATGANGTSGSPSVAGTTLAQASEWAITLLANGNGGGVPTLWTGGFTAASTQHNGSGPYLTWADQVTASTTALTAGATITGTTTWAALLVTLELATTGSGPSVTTSVLRDGTQGSPYMDTVAASGGTPPYTWSVVTGSLPAGLAIDPASGTISGTPSAAGTSAFTVQVIDLASLAGTADLSITIASNLTVTTSGLQAAVAGVPYSAQLNATGGTPPYTWALLAGTMPPGMGLASTGLLSGTPTALGEYFLTVQVTDSAGSTAIA